MVNFFDYIQLAAIAVFLLVIVTKAIYLWVTAGINATAAGRGKRGWGLFFELFAFTGLTVWIIETLLSARAD